MSSRLRGFLSRNRFLVFVVVSLGLTYGWMFIAFGDELLAADPSILLFYRLLYENWYTMIPSLPLVFHLSRAPPIY